MKLSSTSVALARGPLSYDPAILKGEIDRICRALDFVPSPGARVLLKPNLIGGRRRDGLPCTHPRFVAAVAQWFLDHDSRVAIGDSPAFGSARGVMDTCGISEALRGLPVRLVNFDRARSRRLASGIRVGLAKEALECDFLVNLPRVKTHCQLQITMAVKNYFGTVVGVRKPMWHVRFGDSPSRFCCRILELLAVLPQGISLADGIIAMQGQGPMNGTPYPLGLIGGSTNPVALDAALGEVLGLDLQQNPLALEAVRQGLAGSRVEELSFPLLPPAEVARDDFALAPRPAPIRFKPLRILAGGLRRIYALARPGR